MIKPLMQESTDGKSAEIVIEGVITSESFWGDEYTPDQLRYELSKQANGKPITVIINSPGGEVFAGAAIYNALRAYNGEVTVRVDGIAASMASVIAMAGDKILMSPGSVMMVHRPLVLAQGNIKDLSKAIDMLKEIEDTIIPIYEKRTKRSKEEIFSLLEEETWMSPEKAVELGFADNILGDEPTAFAKIKSMFTTENFAFSMSIHDSLGKYIAKEEAEPEKPVEKTEPIEETQEVIPEEVVEDKTKTDIVELADEEETEDSAKINPVNEEDKEMNDKEKQDAIALASIVPIASQPEAPVNLTPTATKREARVKMVDLLGAIYSKDTNKVEAINAELAKMVIDGTTGAPMYAPEIFATDIRIKYEALGGVAALVTKIDIDGAETFRQLVETSGAGFAPVSIGAVKSEDQPVFTPAVFEPFEWALIVAWLDGVQKRSPIAVYNSIVAYIAKEYMRLEDKIILTYVGGTYNGEARPATGLVPILTTAGRVVSVPSYDAIDVIPALGQAYGLVATDGQISIAVNRSTWGQLATSLDNFGRPVFTIVGTQVSAGALGTFNVVISQVLADGDVVIGNFADYDLVTRGQLATLFSREATVGSLNLFTQDASALRADIDITGKPILNSSFVLLQFPAES